jgi:hypothetical protein
MRRALLGLGAILLTANVLSAVPCAASQTTLCLNSSRFQVEVSWRDSRDRTGVGQAVLITADTGYFWFFSQSNIELVVKVLDARGVNGKYWVFFGALSSVQYDLKVTDTTNGASKTYHNPLGQFASVGDTQAFSPASRVTGNEVVEVEGTFAPPDSMDSVQRFIDTLPSSQWMEASPESAATFTPCTEEGAFLFLTSCRFRLEVHWTDSRGRHGVGHPVQLTNDTGYFWFFTDANVELMVKVLDARSVNGNFWVFFGALSNVEYTIHVFDTVSNELHSYQNPPSTFASVGDTAAFRGGYGISVQTDPTGEVSSFISAETGGSLSATAADGTVFTLEIPPDSLFVSERITMTPVRSVDHFPFADGLAAGVDLQPSGIPLLEGATLTIHAPTPIPRSQETPVGWNGSGEDFFLFPPLPAKGDLQLVIFHLGGYGVARGTDAERQTELGRQPVANDDLLSQKISPLLREGRTAAAGNATVPLMTELPLEPKAAATWSSELKAALDQEYAGLKAVMQAASEPSDVVHLITRTSWWVHRAEGLLGQPLDTVFPGRREEILLLWKRMIDLALKKIHDRCSEDPIQIFDVFPMIRIVKHPNTYLLQTFPELQAEIDSVFKCLTFKLKFESVISWNEGEGFVVTTDVVAEGITLRATAQTPLLNVSGEGEIYHKSMSVTGAPDECAPLFSSTPSTFRALLWWNPNDKIVLIYDTGTPKDKVSLSCRGASPSVIGIDFWLSGYDFTHQNQDSFLDEPGYDRIVGDAAVYGHFSITGKKDPWAISILPLTRLAGGIKVAEYTVFTLTHTPE